MASEGGAIVRSSLMNAMRPVLPLTGGCQCGAIRYEIASFPLLLYTLSTGCRPRDPTAWRYCTRHCSEFVNGAFAVKI
jgi:hypothetical protein